MIKKKRGARKRMNETNKPKSQTSRTPKMITSKDHPTDTNKRETQTPYPLITLKSKIPKKRFANTISNKQMHSTNGNINHITLITIIMGLLSLYSADKINPNSDNQKKGEKTNPQPTYLINQVKTIAILIYILGNEIPKNHKSKYKSKGKKNNNHKQPKKKKKDNRKVTDKKLATRDKLKIAMIIITCITIQTLIITNPNQKEIKRDYILNTKVTEPVKPIEKEFEFPPLKIEQTTGNLKASLIIWTLIIKKTIKITKNIKKNLKKQKRDKQKQNPKRENPQKDIYQLLEVVIDDG
jgi:amino acid transporter